MLKSQLEEELKKTKELLEELKKLMAERKREFLAMGEAMRRTKNEEIITFLTNFFEYDENGCITGFNRSEIDYYCWLSEEPERKKAL